MDPFTVIIFGGLAGLVIALLLLGKYFPGSGADQLDWKPTRSAEVEIQNELDDLDQMLEATNARRRARGKPELTEEGIRASIGDDLAEKVKRRDDYMGDLDVQQMLDKKNERRKRKGLPPLTRAEYEASLQDPPAS